MRDRATVRAAMVALIAGLAACAETPPASPTQTARVRSNKAALVGPPPCAGLFVSPSGEPFRLAPGGACPLDTWFAGADANHDGEISRSEFKADAARFFATLDVNGDGVLEPEEVQRYEREIAPEILGRPREAMAEPHLVLAQFSGGGMGGGMGGGSGGRGGGGRHHQNGGSSQPHEAGLGSSPDGLARYSLMDEPEPVASGDLNFDGKITAEEFAARASQRFETLKVDVGALSLPALQARMAARAGNHQRTGSRAERRRGGANGGVGVGAH